MGQRYVALDQARWPPARDQVYAQRRAICACDKSHSSRPVLSLLLDSECRRNGVQTVTDIPFHAEKKTLMHRSAPDLSQYVRQIAQWFFVALKAWMDVRFYL